MKILQVSTMDIGGGAEKVALNLHQAYQNSGHQSWLVVGRKKGTDPGVIEIPKYHSRTSQALINFRDQLRTKNKAIRGLQRVIDLLNWIAHLGKLWDIRKGLEDFRYPGSRRLLRLMNDAPDILHVHNLHGGYFDLRYLPILSKQIPLIITLHDEWMLTGHCAYSLGCGRWEQGCGSCPDLTIYPSINRDATTYNWKRKRNIYFQSRLYVATPSHWLMDRVQRSMMQPIESRVIPNGIDLDYYYPGERVNARRTLGLPVDARIILSIAKQSRFKDYDTIMSAVKKIGQDSRLESSRVIFIALGSGKSEAQRYGNVLVQNTKFISDPGVVAKYIQSADVFLHAAQAENFPNTILEAFACGATVVATDVGGIWEQVENDLTGFLVPKGDSVAMAERSIQLLINDDLRHKMSNMASDIVKKRFSLDHQVNEYISWYKEILETHALSNSMRAPANFFQ